MNMMTEKILTIYPELALLVGAVFCLILGLNSNKTLRKLTPWTASLAILAATVLAIKSMMVCTEESHNLVFTFTGFVKLSITIVGLLLLLLATNVPTQIKATFDAEQNASKGKSFDPANSIRGEFFAFFLLSLIGAMLCAGASDLIWLFLALELTSLPTYVMIATTKDQPQAREATVKYFFLGALAAAIFLYGFSLIYGATGFTQFNEIQSFIATQQTYSPLLITGFILAFLGLAFKIAAVPMHFYAADVYQGANTPMTAFLSFVPKTAGFVALIILLNLFPSTQPLPQAITTLIWIMAVTTMTVGNTLGILQDNIKRTLAYSSVAHSGYMLVALLILHNTSPQPIGNGTAALLFYLLTYGLGSVATLGALSLIKTRNEEAQTYDDISGIAKSQPIIASVLLVGVLSLLGFPLMAGFIGKVYLFGSAMTHGHIALVIIAVLNSAVSAAYYLRIAGAAFFGKPNEQSTITDNNRAASVAIVLAMIIIIAIGISPLGDKLVQATNLAVNNTTIQINK